MSAPSTLSVPSNSLNTVHVAIPIYGKAVTDAGTVRCHAGMLTLPRRHGNVVTPAWQRCYAGMATLLCRHGNVVMPAWQPITRHAERGMSLSEMDFCLWRTGIGKAEMALWQARFVVISAPWRFPLSERCGTRCAGRRDGTWVCAPSRCNGRAARANSAKRPPVPRV